MSQPNCRTWKAPRAEEWWPSAGWDALCCRRAPSMNPLTVLVALTANGIPPIKERAPPPPRSAYELRAKKRTTGSMSMRSARRVPTPPRQAVAVSARRPGDGKLVNRTIRNAPKETGDWSPKREVIRDVITMGSAPRPPAYAMRFGWSADEERQWLSRARRKRWLEERKRGKARELPQAGIVQSEASVASVASVASIPQDERIPPDELACWCRKAGWWVAEPPNEDAAIREAAEGAGMAAAVVKDRSPLPASASLPHAKPHRAPDANRRPVGPSQAAVARAPGVALSTLRAGLDGAVDAIEDFTAPRMQDGLDHGSGAWWGLDGATPRGGKKVTFPPLKPALHDNISSMVSLRLNSPRERGRIRAEPLSLTGKQAKQFYGVEVL